MMRQQAEIYVGQLDAGKQLIHATSDHLPHVWIQMIKGSVSLSDISIGVGDSVAIDASDLDSLSLTAGTDAEFLFFQLA